MHPLLLTAIAILHLGPGIAFVVVAFGCGTVDPTLGELCTVGDFKLFAGTTLLSWAVLTSAAAAIHVLSRRRMKGIKK
jgi:hypothetical protein